MPNRMRGIREELEIVVAEFNNYWITWWSSMGEIYNDQYFYM
jgi:hypothetical protein